MKEVDADRFERAAEEGRAILARGDSAGGARALRRALAEWRGEVFADLGGGELVEAEASRLSELRLGGARGRDGG